MGALQPVSRRTLDDLEEAIVSLSGRINAFEYQFLTLVREFDLRRGWRAYHFNSCAEWLNFKCGLCPGTAREKLRVAYALFDLPAVSDAFRNGQLSYSKTRALTRIATPANERKLLDYALGATARDVDEYCRRLRNVYRDVSTRDAERLHRDRHLYRRTHGDGSVTISIELPQEQGELVYRALEMALSTIESELESDEAAEGEESLFAREADAMVEVARGYLAGGREQRSCTADHYQVVVHVDEEVLRGEPEESSSSDLPAESVRRICCDSSMVILREDARGNPLNVGRAKRVVTPALRRALHARDRHCRFPGCTHTRWLDAHHVMHWADGGETALENLVLLCSRHHRLLHEGGFSIRAVPDGQFEFSLRSG